MFWRNFSQVRRNQLAASTEVLGFEDKRVVAVGIGNSGADIAVELSRVSEQVRSALLLIECFESHCVALTFTLSSFAISCRKWIHGALQEILYSEYLHIKSLCHNFSCTSQLVEEPGFWIAYTSEVCLWMFAWLVQLTLEDDLNITAFEPALGQALHPHCALLDSSLDSFVVRAEDDQRPLRPRCVRAAAQARRVQVNSMNRLQILNHVVVAFGIKINRNHWKKD